MATRIYISKTGKGWEEAFIPDNYKHYSYEALVSMRHEFLDPTKYKGILVTENPDIPSTIKHLR